MPAPSPLAIATGVLTRLVKEEASYHKELEKQEARLKKTQESADDEEGNKEFTLKQEVRTNTRRAWAQGRDIARQWD